MGNRSSITEDRVSGPVGPVDYGKLHAYVSNLLMDAAALSEHCRELWDDVHGADAAGAAGAAGAVDFLPQEELQPVTQRLIDSLGCRHPGSLERIGAVYSTFAHREGLSLLEFQGYVACVLTQILRELEARSTGSVESLERDDSEHSLASSATPAPRAPFAVTLAETKEPVQDLQESRDALEELSELQRLTQELTSLNTSLARLEAPVEALVAEPPAAAEPPLAEAPAAVEAPAEAPVEARREMATLLTTLEDLNRSLGQLDRLDPSQQKMAGEPEIQQIQQKPKTGSPGSPGSRSHRCARQPEAAAAQAEKAHHLEQVFPQQPRMPNPAAHPATVAIGAAIDPGNTYARALRGGVHEMAGEVRPWTRLDVEASAASQEAATAGEPQPEEALRPMANSWLHSRLNGASKGLAHSWQAFAETMDSIFVPEARFGQAMPEATPQTMPEMPEMPEAPPSAQPVEEDVPAIFRQPTVEEVQEVLEQEGLPAYVAIASAGTFCAKKLCLDSSSSPYLYVLEPDSSIPAVFFGMQGFCLEDLRRIVLSEAPLDSTSKPLLSLEFDDGFLPVRLGSALVLRGLVGVLCHGRNVQIMQQSA